MKKATPIKISIPDPCTQNWADMPEINNARFCNTCKYIIHDFTQMNDDELFRFIKQSPVIPCGRFHKEQSPSPQSLLCGGHVLSEGLLRRRRKKPC